LSSGAESSANQDSSGFFSLGYDDVTTTTTTTTPIDTTLPDVSSSRGIPILELRDDEYITEMIRDTGNGGVLFATSLGRILGPRGLMPNPKTGTVTMDIKKAVDDVKAGKIDFKVDKTGIIHAAVAKTSFDDQKILENAKELLTMVMKLKPSASKGTYVKSIYMSSTMSYGIQVDPKSIVNA